MAGIVTAALLLFLFYIFAGRNKGVGDYYKNWICDV